jgi:PTH2 family peptidyl-tRNA hydrolase
MIKQVIVMRKDLKMRRGKEIAQGAHASMAFLVKKTVQGKGYTLTEIEWMKGLFTKICVRVDSEAELLKVVEAAREAGIQAELITDSGKTEFAGVPTPTCAAIGPDDAEKIDKVTGHLELY